MVVVGRHAVQKRGGVARMTGEAGAPHECEVETLLTPDHTAFQVRSSV